VQVFPQLVQRQQRFSSHSSQFFSQFGSAKKQAKSASEERLDNCKESLSKISDSIMELQQSLIRYLESGVVKGETFGFSAGSRSQYLELCQNNRPRDDLIRILHFILGSFNTNMIPDPKPKEDAKANMMSGSKLAFKMFAQVQAEQWWDKDDKSSFFKQSRQQQP
jgi:hypothetical protein